MNIEEIINQIPLFTEKEVIHEPLNGGLSNQTYKLTCDETSYVLRIFGDQLEFLPLTRGSEINVAQTLNMKAYCPAVLYADPFEKYVLLEYIEGRQVTGEDLVHPSIYQQIITQMKNIHDSEEVTQSVPRRCSPYQLVDSYLRGADQLHVKQPEGLAPLLNNMEKIAYRRSCDKTYTHKFCHNDYYLFNLIWSPQSQKLNVVDWELCGMGDAFFDLASIPFTNGFTQEQEILWLKSYFGFYEEEQYVILQDMKYMNMLRECAWGLLHSGLNQDSVNHNFEYYRHVEHVIARLQQGFNYL